MTEMGEINVAVSGFARRSWSCHTLLLFHALPGGIPRQLPGCGITPLPVLIGFRILGFCEDLPDAQAAVDSLLCL